MSKRNRRVTKNLSAVLICIICISFALVSGLALSKVIPSTEEPIEVAEAISLSASNVLKAPTANSTSEGIAKMFDGDTSTIYHSTYNSAYNPSTNCYILIDLGKTRNLHTVYYTPRSGNSNGRFEYCRVYGYAGYLASNFTGTGAVSSLTDAGFTRINKIDSKVVAQDGDKVYLQDSSYIQTIDLDGGEYRYVAIVVDDVHGEGNNLSCAELSIMSTGSSGTARQLKLTSSSVVWAPTPYSTSGSSDGPVTNMFDGNTSTYYHSNWNSVSVSTTQNCYILIDLGASYYPRMVKYTPRQSGTNGNLRGCAIKASASRPSNPSGAPSELSSYTTVGSTTFVDSTVDQTVSLYTSTKYRYLAIQVTSATVNGHMSGAELKIYVSDTATNSTVTKGVGSSNREGGEHTVSAPYYYNEYDSGTYVMDPEAILYSNSTKSSVDGYSANSFIDPTAVAWGRVAEEDYADKNWTYRLNSNGAGFRINRSGYCHWYYAYTVVELGDELLTALKAGTRTLDITLRLFCDDSLTNYFNMGAYFTDAFEPKQTLGLASSTTYADTDGQGPAYDAWKNGVTNKKGSMFNTAAYGKETQVGSGSDRTFSAVPSDGQYKKYLNIGVFFRKYSASSDIMSGLQNFRIVTKGTGTYTAEPTGTLSVTDQNGTTLSSSTDWAQKKTLTYLISDPTGYKIDLHKTTVTYSGSTVKTLAQLIKEANANFSVSVGTTTATLVIKNQGVGFVLNSAVLYNQLGKDVSKTISYTIQNLDTTVPGNRDTKYTTNGGAETTATNLSTWASSKSIIFTFYDTGSGVSWTNTKLSYSEVYGGTTVTKSLNEIEALNDSNFTVVASGTDVILTVKNKPAGFTTRSLALYDNVGLGGTHDKTYTFQNVLYTAPTLPSSLSPVARTGTSDTYVDGALDGAVVKANTGSYSPVTYPNPSGTPQTDIFYVMAVREGAAAPTAAELFVTANQVTSFSTSQNLTLQNAASGAGYYVFYYGIKNVVWEVKAASSSGRFYYEPNALNFSLSGAAISPEFSVWTSQGYNVTVSTPSGSLPGKTYKVEATLSGGSTKTWGSGLSNTSNTYTFSVSDFDFVGGQGDLSYTVKITDGLGRTQSLNSASNIKFDKIAPSFSINPSTASGVWTASDITIGKTATATNLAPVEYRYWETTSSYTEVTVTDAIWNTAGSTIVVSSANFTATQNKYYYFLAKTDAGVYYHGAIYNAKIDKDAPAFSVTPSVASGTWTSPDINLSRVNATNLSASETEYRYWRSTSTFGTVTANATSWASAGYITLGTAVTLTDTENAYYIFMAKSPAGLYYVTAEYNARIDRVAPTFGISPSVASTVWTNASAITVDITGAASNISPVEYKYLKGTPSGTASTDWANATASISDNSFSITAAEVADYYIMSKSASGLYSSAQYQARIDRTEKAFSLVGSLPQYINNDTLSVSISLSSEYDGTNKAPFSLYYILNDGTSDGTPVDFSASMTDGDETVALSKTLSSATGIFTVKIKSVDEAGNTFVLTLGSAKIDARNYTLNFNYNNVKGSFLVDDAAAAASITAKLGDSFTFKVSAITGNILTAYFVDGVSSDITDAAEFNFVADYKGAAASDITYSFSAIFKTVVSFSDFTGLYQVGRPSFSAVTYKSYAYGAEITTPTATTLKYFDSSNDEVSFSADLPDGKYLIAVAVDDDDYIGSYSTYMVLVTNFTATVIFHSNVIPYSGSDYYALIFDSNPAAYYKLELYSVDTSGVASTSYAVTNDAIKAVLSQAAYTLSVKKQGSTVTEMLTQGEYAVTMSRTVNSGTSYAIDFSDTLTISKIVVTVSKNTDAQNPEKTYDGSTAASFKGNGLFDYITISHNFGSALSEGLFDYTFVYDSASAGERTVTLTITSLTDENFRFVIAEDVEYYEYDGKINKKDVTFTSVKDYTKPYDGTAAVNGFDGTYYSLQGIIDDDLDLVKLKYTLGSISVGGSAVADAGSTGYYFDLTSVSIAYIATDAESENYSLVYPEETDYYRINASISRVLLTDFAGSVANKEFDGTCTFAITGFSATGIVSGEDTLDSYGVYTALSAAYVIYKGGSLCSVADVVGAANYTVVFSDDYVNNYRFEDTVQYITFKIERRVVNVVFDAGSKPFDTYNVSGAYIVSAGADDINTGNAINAVAIKDSQNAAYTLISGYTLTITYANSSSTVGSYTLTTNASIAKGGTVDNDNFTINLSSLGFDITKITVAVDIAKTSVRYSGGTFTENLASTTFSAFVSGVEISTALYTYISGFTAGVTVGILDAESALATEAGSYNWGITNNITNENFSLVAKENDTVVISPREMYIIGEHILDTIVYGELTALSNLSFSLLDYDKSESHSYGDAANGISVSLSRIGSGTIGLFGNAGSYNYALDLSGFSSNFRIANAVLDGGVYYIDNTPIADSGEATGKKVLEITAKRIVVDFSSFYETAYTYGAGVNLGALTYDLTGYTAAGLNDLGIFSVALLIDDSNVINASINLYTTAGVKITENNVAGLLNFGIYKASLDGAFDSGNYEVENSSTYFVQFAINRKEIYFVVDGSISGREYDGNAVPTSVMSYIVYSYTDDSVYTEDLSYAFSFSFSVDGIELDEIVDARTYKLRLSYTALSLAGNYEVKKEPEAIDFVIEPKPITLSLLYSDTLAALSDRAYVPGSFDVTNPGMYTVTAEGLVKSDAVGVCIYNIVKGEKKSAGFEFAVGVKTLVLSTGKTSNYKYTLPSGSLVMERIGATLAASLTQVYSTGVYTPSVAPTYGGIDGSSATELAKLFNLVDGALAYVAASSTAALDTGSYTDALSVDYDADSIYYDLTESVVTLTVTPYVLSGFSVSITVGSDPRIEYTTKYSEYKSTVLDAISAAISTKMGENTLVATAFMSALELYAGGVLVADDTVLSIAQHGLTLALSEGNVSLGSDIDAAVVVIISKIAVSVSFTVPEDLVYTGLAKEVTYDIENFKSISDIDVTFGMLIKKWDGSDYTDTYTEIINAGKYSVGVVMSDGGEDYYELTSPVIYVTVSPRAITTMSIDDLTYSGTARTIVPVFRDANSTVYVPESYDQTFYYNMTSAVEAAIKAGLYLSTVVLTDENYTSNGNLNATFTVHKSSAEIATVIDLTGLTYNNADRDYDGTETTPEMYGIPENIHEIGYSYSVNGGVVICDASSYTVTFVVSSPNFTTTKTLYIAYKINKASAYVDIVQAPLPVYEYSVARTDGIEYEINAYTKAGGDSLSEHLSFKYNDKLGFTIPASEVRNAGEYRLVVSMSHGNYEIKSVLSFSFEITPKQLAPVGEAEESYTYSAKTFKHDIKLFDGDYEVPTVMAYQLLLNGNYATLSTLPKDAGVYRLVVTIASGYDNYMLIDGVDEYVYDFVVEKYKIRIEVPAEVKEYAYDNTFKTAAYLLDGVLVGDNASNIKVSAVYKKNGVTADGCRDLGSYTGYLNIDNKNYYADEAVSYLRIVNNSFSGAEISDTKTSYDGKAKAIGVALKSLPSGIAHSSVVIAYKYERMGAVVAEPINAGVYQATVTFSRYGFETKVLTAVLTIEKIDIPGEYERGSGTIIVNEVSGAKYRLSDGTSGNDWQDSNVFTGLENGMSYEIEIMVEGEYAENFTTASSIIQVPIDVVSGSPNMIIILILAIVGAAVLIFIGIQVIKAR